MQYLIRIKISPTDSINSTCFMNTASRHVNNQKAGYKDVKTYKICKFTNIKTYL